MSFDNVLTRLGYDPSDPVRDREIPERLRRRLLAPGSRVIEPPLERFCKHVHKTESCWLWTGSLDTSGYGILRVGKKTTSAHRFAYEVQVGLIAGGMQLDHLCCVRNCVNPAHLEQVTPEENMRRVRERNTHCQHGHEFTPENTYWMRACRICQVERQRERRRKGSA